jgi:hypothetical protein
MVFVAFAREDAASLTSLMRALAARGVDAVHDIPQPTSNPHWRIPIALTLRRASTVVVIWSRHAEASPWLEQEIRGGAERQVWLHLDATPVPVDKPQPTRSVRSIAAAVDAVCEVDAPTGHRVRSSPEPFALWRRNEAFTEGARLLERVHSSESRSVCFRAAGEHYLVEETTDMWFRHVVGEAYLAVMSSTAGQLAEIADRLHIARAWPRQRLELPAAGVTWFEAMAVCRWFGGTLPSEDLWYRAASAHATRDYATASGAIDPSLAAYGAAIGSGSPVPQDTYPPNALGFFGMCGNTWDWCADASGPHRSIRGGCWLDSARFCRADARYRNAAVDRDDAVGFRVAIRARHRTGSVYEAIRS